MCVWRFFLKFLRISIKKYLPNVFASSIFCLKGHLIQFNTKRNNILRAVFGLMPFAANILIVERIRRIIRIPVIIFVIYLYFNWKPYIFARVSVGSEEYLCTDAWFAPYVASHPIVPPTMRVQKVWRLVGSVSKL